MADMTREVIVALCKANGGYAAPHLNDQLFLHCKGFMRIANLEAYENAKVLWLEQNAISDLSGLEKQQQLISLFLQNNAIRSLRTLATPLRNLRVINLSHNYLTSLAGIGTACPQLETLQASHNRIASFEACEDLFLLASTLTSVDLSFNQVISYAAAAADAVAGEDDAADERPANALFDNNGRAIPSIADDVRVVEVVEDEKAAGAAAADSQMHGQQPLVTVNTDPLVVVHFFTRLPNVSVVYLQGNPISHGLRHYRRNMILHLPALTYLDERPVFPEERRVVEAWGRAGAEAESAERAAIREEKKQHLSSCVRVLTDRMEANRELRDRLTRQWDVKRAEEMAQLTQLRREHRDARAAFASREQAMREAVEGEERAARWEAEEAAAEALIPLVAAEPQHRHEYEQRLAVQAATEEAEREIAAAAAQAQAAAAVTATADQSLSRWANSLPGAAAARPTGKETTLAELMKSDDDILREMEDEIDNVLGSLETSFAVGESRRRASQCISGAAEPSQAAGTAVLSSSLGAADAAATALQWSTVTATAKAERAVHAAVGQVSSRLRRSLGCADTASSGRDVWAQFSEWERKHQIAM